MKNLDQLVFEVLTATPDQEEVLRTKAKILLKALYEEEDYEKIIAKLLVSEDAVVNYLHQNVAAFQDLMNKPTLEVLQAYKDKMQIPDHLWDITVYTFRLGNYATIHHLKREQHSENQALPIVMTPGGKGAQINILTYLRWCVEGLDPLSSDTDPILLKFVFDGGRMTSRQKKAEEIGTFNLLFPGQPLSEVRSPNNSHQWTIFFAEESRAQTCEKNLQRGSRLSTAYVLVGVNTNTTITNCVL